MKMKMKFSFLVAVLMVFSATGWAANIAPDATITTTSGEYVWSGHTEYFHVEFVADGDTAFNGLAAWCSERGASSTSTFEVTLEWDSAVTIDQIKLYNAGADGSSSNTSDFRYQVSSDGSVWTDVANSAVTGNTSQVCTFDLATAITTEYLRLYITEPVSTDIREHARVAEIEVYEVPEPATLGLLSLGGIAGLIRRRK
ncbi:MAG: discoidin domain-containing protein [candidate division Zixibacteria bacterium]|nr:discoidin domain-containing protein [candidate division Zixibacteria bacterium]